MVGTLLLTFLGCLPSDSFRTADNRLELQTTCYRCILDARLGSIVRLQAHADRPIAGHEGSAGLWRLTYRDGQSLTAADAASSQPPRARWEDARSTLVMTWDCPSASVTVSVRSAQDRLLLTAEVENRRSAPVIAVAMPVELAIHPDALGVLTWPESIGLGLTRQWVETPGREPSRWQAVARGPELMRLLLGFGAKMLELPGTPRPLRVTEAARKLLPDSVCNRLAGRPAVVTRPPEKQPDIVMLENDDGPYLSGFRLGGEGLFMYFAGRSDAETAEALVPAILKSWLAQRPDRKAALVVARGWGHGGWMDVPIEDWMRRLPPALGENRLVILRSPEALASVLSEPSVAAVFNPYAEHLMARDIEDARRLVSLIARFVRRGGLWLDAGGYPLYYLLMPSRFGELSASYPPAFCDMIHVDGPLGRLAVWGLQQPGEVFVPARMRLAGQELDGAPSATYTHEYAAWVNPGQRWVSPSIALVLGLDLPSASREYLKANGIEGSKLTTKLPPEKAHRFLQSVLIRLHGRTCKDYMACIERLPRPAIIHMTEHLHVGFDKAYPDYLPPPPDFGTVDELRELYRKARGLGFLMMPYVNPTWWCDQSPSLAQYGDQVLAIGLDGKPYREAYGHAEPRNRGWSICALHPLVRQLDDRCLQQFVDDLGADILFQDQIGARGWLYDLNPAEPTPYAYTEGMIALARHDSQRVPLSTERGWDRLIPYEVQFCGVAYAAVPKRGRALWLPCFWERFDEGEWLFSPVALYMAHDRVAFALHDLGHFVEDEASLAMALALGHQMSLSIATGTSEQTARFQWLRWLDTVQKHVACRYMPQPLTSFAHLTPLCVKAAYGPITVIASLEREPVSVDGVKVASPGFYARSANGAIEAGRLVEYAGRRYDPPLEFIRERGPAEEHWWLFGSSPVVLPADGARAAYEVLGTVRRQSKVVQSDQAKWIVATPPLLGAQPPAELAERPPAQWPQAPQYIGVVAMEPNGPDPAWSDAGPDKWIEALTKSDILSRLAIKVRKLRAPDEVLIACQQPRTVLAIINPYGERFPVEAPERAEAMLDAVSAYVRNGGIWWETGGYSFFYPCWPQRTNGRITGWQSGRGMGGLSHILGSPLVLPDGLPPEKLAVTDSARALLTAETASKLDGAEAVVNRPLPPEQDGWSLLVGPSGPYIAGYQLAGWGYLFRVGGVGRLELTLPIVEAVTAKLWQTAPRDWPQAQISRVWEVVVAK